MSSAKETNTRKQLSLDLGTACTKDRENFLAKQLEEEHQLVGQFWKLIRGDD